MQLPDFKGADKLIAMLDEAVQQGEVDAITQSIKQGLCRMVRERDFRLPACVHDQAEQHYARRLLYRSPEHGYSVVAMTWGPEQGTPLHDHAGLWCVEAVCDGRIAVTQYELEEHEGERFRFRRCDRVEAGVGTAGCLIPPHEYHTIANCCGQDCAVSLHIYGGDMEACNAFIPVGNGWYEREAKPLGFDALTA